MKPRIKLMIWNIRKQKTSNQYSKKENNSKKQDGVRSLWDKFKHTNIRIIRVPDGKEKEQEIENLFEKITNENFPNLVKEIDIQLQEVQRVLNKLDAKRPTPRHIIIKMSKVKDKKRILKTARENQRVTYKGVPIRLSADFSKETLQARRNWQEVSKARIYNLDYSIQQTYHLELKGR